MIASSIPAPREWSLTRPESRAATLILGVIGLGSSTKDQVSRVFEIYREYSQSEAARAVAIAPSGEEVVSADAYDLGASVASILLDLARCNCVTDETRESLTWIAGQGARS